MTDNKPLYRNPNKVSLYANSREFSLPQARAEINRIVNLIGGDSQTIREHTSRTVRLRSSWKFTFLFPGGQKSANKAIAEVLNVNRTTETELSGPSDPRGGPPIVPGTKHHPGEFEEGLRTRLEHGVPGIRAFTETIVQPDASEPLRRDSVETGLEVKSDVQGPALS